MKIISICIPVFNEEINVLNTYNEIVNLFKKKLINYNYEIIFTDNHSSDRTEEIIMDLCNKDNKVKYIRFRANLEYDKSILEGYKNSGPGSWKEDESQEGGPARRAPWQARGGGSLRAFRRAFVQ